jgi:hypothetical protein
MNQMGVFYQQPHPQMGFMHQMPPPPQNQGFFGNFIMNQLSQNMQGPYPLQQPMFYGFQNPQGNRY